MPDVLHSALAFLVVLGVLVFVHEFGHYLAARLVGVHVEVFSIGFGPAIVTWRDRVGTVWKLAWLPLGGYVKLHGQERPEEPVHEPAEPSRVGLAIAGWRERAGLARRQDAAPREPEVVAPAPPKVWIAGKIFHEKSV